MDSVKYPGRSDYHRDIQCMPDPFIVTPHRYLGYENAGSLQPTRYLQTAVCSKRRNISFVGLKADDS